MRKSILGLVLGATMLTAPLAMAPSASAEPRYDIWKCFHPRDDTWTMSKYRYYECPHGTILLIDSYTARERMRLDGACANRLWHNSGRRATYQDAMNRCDE